MIPNIASYILGGVLIAAIAGIFAFAFLELFWKRKKPKIEVMKKYLQLVGLILLLLLMIPVSGIVMGAVVIVFAVLFGGQA